MIIQDKNRRIVLFWDDSPSLFKGKPSAYCRWQSTCPGTGWRDGRQLRTCHTWRLIRYAGFATGRGRSLSRLSLFQIRYGFRGRVGVVSRSAARKTGGFLPESIVARRNSIQQISHRWPVWIIPVLSYTYRWTYRFHTILYRTIWHITNDNIWRTT